ncbi:S8 family serine peptidase [Ornithinimicrobium sediminis]|uniref:S8 family serine peptidase n=1 Tax=Ornithinimicrobium sediminis TaxID=2904603 RepID=UPI001E5259AB|nr:S8 family serine peptidase [Ornithinimicrobium sediminis]MCE0487935.1 S8 family serine peptidase [Ornithinimicrobium sediminis]
MSRLLRLLVTGSATAAVLAGTALPATVVAAPDPDGPAAPPAHAQGHEPGKGDTDGDRVADDLEAALDELGPGERVDVIVQGTTPSEARRAARSFTVDHTYATIPAFSGSVTAGQVTALARIPGVTRVELDGVARTADAAGDRDYGVDAARVAVAPGDGVLDGSGVGICVIDTGIDPGHEQLSGRVVGWNDWVNGRAEPYDDHGHGTHVAGIAAGDGTGSAAAADYGGVAGDAWLIGAKVLSSAGSGADSDVAAAIEWCAGRADVHVISMSLGSPGGDGADAGSQAADAAVAAGKVVVVAAGNSGDAPGTVSSPGVATHVVTVGAASDYSRMAGGLDTDDGLYLAGFSSRGPTTNPQAALKPDLVGPGMSVVAAQANTTSSYVAYSGTSMATPFVAGVVALGLEAEPGATPAQVKSALQASARDAGTAGPDNEWGHGLVDARAFLAALQGTAAATAPWPAHTLLEGSVGSGAVRDYPFEVAVAGEPLGVTMQTTNGAAQCALWLGTVCWFGYEWAPDLDAYLVDPAGTVVAVSRCMLEATNGNCAAPGRFETLGVPSAAAGTWTLRVESFSGSGAFAASVFAGSGTSEPPPPPPPPDTEPSAPTALTASGVTTSTVDLSWTDTADNETGFRVERCEGAACTGFNEVGTVGADVSSFTDTGLGAGTTYRYRVSAFNDVGASAWAGPVSATTEAAPPPPPSAPSAPTDVTAQATAKNKVSVTWTDTATDESGFRVERCTGAGCTSFTQVGAPGADSTSYDDRGLRANTTYGYRVLAWNDSGEAASGVVYVTTPRR